MKDLNKIRVSIVLIQSGYFNFQQKVNKFCIFYFYFVFALFLTSAIIFVLALIQLSVVKAIKMHVL